MDMRITDQFYADLAEFCVARLGDALNPETALFDRQLRDKAWNPTLGTEDVTSTAICLIGIDRAGIAADDVGLTPARTIEAMAEAARRRAYPGAAGLAIWANAVWDHIPLTRLLSRMGIAFDSPRGLINGLTTMETAWLVSGLTHECRRSADPLAARVLDVAVKALLGRFEPHTGVFRHAANAGPLAHRLRKWVANFADQIYSVQALSFHAITHGGSESADSARQCAERLIALQGSLGQWWWHYDPRDGRVAQSYPVYSVHQHGMAPMALLALSQAVDADYRRAITLSQAWLRRNELGVDLVDRAAGTIWRDIEPDEGRLGRTVRQARSVVGWKAPAGAADPAGLKINHETRPYEWAWCLYAGAIDTGRPAGTHIV